MLSATVVIGNLLLPPAVLGLILLEALVVFRSRRGAAFVLVFLVTVALLGLSLPGVAGYLCRGLEEYPPLQVEQIDPQAAAIVVLAGGAVAAREYQGNTINALSLERLRYGARLHRVTGLPLMLVGGYRVAEGSPEAELMARALEKDFGLEAAWLESESRNTAENARFAAKRLREIGIGHVLLVTHAFHMPRAVNQFEAHGIDVQAAPTRFCGGEGPRWTPADFVPNGHAFYWSYLALHEYLGGLWYALSE